MTDAPEPEGGDTTIVLFGVGIGCLALILLAVIAVVLIGMFSGGSALPFIYTVF